MNKKTFVIDSVTIVAAVCAVVLTGMAVHDRFGSDVVRRRDRQVPDWHDHAAEGHRLGPATAPVTIIEFGDYQCPACRALEPRLSDLRRRYPEKIAIVYRHWPLPYHPLSYPAARAAECAAAQGRFEEYHASLFDQSEWLTEGTTGLKEMASRASVSDVAAFDACMEDDGAVPAVERDIEAANALGGSGTPMLIVNGILLGVPDPSLLEKHVIGVLKSAGEW